MDSPDSISRAQLAEMFAVIGLDTRQLIYVEFTPNELTIEYVNEPAEVVKIVLITHKRKIPIHG